MSGKDKASYNQYKRDHRRARKEGLPGTNVLKVGVRGFEPPTSASQTLRAKPTALHPGVCPTLPPSHPNSKLEIRNPK